MHPRSGKGCRKKSGEILTEEDVVQRLLLEEQEMQTKKTKLTLAKALGEKTNQEEQNPNIRFSCTTRRHPNIKIN